MVRRPEAEIQMLRHVVLFTFQDETTEAQKQAAADGLKALPGLIPEIRRYELGRDAGLAAGNHDFALVADFDSEADFRAYAEHPEHVKVVVELIKPVISGRVAVQYRLTDPR